MMKWAIIDNCGVDEFKKIFSSKEQALDEAENDWFHLSDFDKRTRVSYLVGLINVDDNGDYYEDDNGNIDGDIYDIAKEFK